MKRQLLLSFLLVAAACGKKTESSPSASAGPAGSAQAGSAQAGSAQAGSAQAGTGAGGSAAVALPGPCVDPVADADKRYATDAAASGGPSPEDVGAAHAEAAPDLDGDGTPDKMFSFGLGVTSNTYLYVMRGACGHFVGDIVMPPEPPNNPARNHGLIDLRSIEAVSCEGAPCGCEEGWSVHRFDGTTYKLDEKASKASVEKPCK